MTWRALMEWNLGIGWTQRNALKIPTIHKIGSVIELCSGTYENFSFKSHMYDIMYAQDPRASVHKQVIHTLVTYYLTL